MHEDSRIKTACQLKASCCDNLNNKKIVSVEIAWCSSKLSL